MSRAQMLLGDACTVALAAVCLGLALTRRYRLWYTFALYLVTTLVYGVLIIWRPERFFAAEVWQTQQIILNLVRFAMAIELSLRTFRPFPAALAALRRLGLLILAGTLVAVLAVALPGLDYRTFVAQIQPRVLNGTVWLFTAMAALILWYRLPIHAFYKTVLLTYVPYLLVFTVVVHSMGTLWEREAWVQYANQFAYLGLLICWNYAAWRPERAPAVAAPSPQRAPRTA